jgi:hypothetical protein
MSTPRSAFAAVAAAVAGLRADDAVAVEAFYSRVLLDMPEAARIAVADFLSAQTETPSPAALQLLVRHLEAHGWHCVAAPRAAAVA